MGPSLSKNILGRSYKRTEAYERHLIPQGVGLRVFSGDTTSDMRLEGQKRGQSSRWRPGHAKAARCTAATTAMCFIVFYQAN